MIALVTGGGTVTGGVDTGSGAEPVTLGRLDVACFRFEVTWLRIEGTCEASAGGSCPAACTTPCPAACTTPWVAVPIGPAPEPPVDEPPVDEPPVGAPPDPVVPGPPPAAEFTGGVAEAPLGPWAPEVDGVPEWGIAGALAAGAFPEVVDGVRTPLVLWVAATLASATVTTPAAASPLPLTWEIAMATREARRAMRSKRRRTEAPAMKMPASTRTSASSRVLALQGLASPPEQRLDGGDLDPLRRRDLLVGEARLLAEREDLAVSVRQAGQRLDGELAVECGHHRVLRTHGGGEGVRPSRVVGRLVVEVLDGAVAGAPTKSVGAEVLRDDAQPRIEAQLAGEGGERPPCAQECLLGDLVRLVAIDQAAHAEAVQPVVVLGVQLSERSSVAVLAPAHECAVPVEIDVPPTRPLFGALEPVVCHL